MPEIAKVNGPEEASSKTEEPGIGAKKIADHPAEDSSNLIETSSAELLALSPGPEKASQELEGSKAPQPENPEEKSTDTFAGDIADGPAEAVETQENDDLNEGEDSSDHENEEGFFTGWDGFDEIHELSADEELADDEEQTQPFEGEAGHRTLSEIALASGILQTLDDSSDAGPGLSSKHDELAEAVQAALMSVYGEAPSARSRQKELAVAGHARLRPWLGKRGQPLSPGRDPELLRLPAGPRKRPRNDLGSRRCRVQRRHPQRF